MRLTSPAFGPGERIPDAHTCEGGDVSPALAWDDAPPGTRSLALVMDDPDAPRGTFTHWLAWGIEADAGGLAQGAAPARQGLNGFGGLGYGGPCPPRGHGPHHYRFRLHALDSPLPLGSGADRRALEDALSGHVLEVAELVGVVERA